MKLSNVKRNFVWLGMMLAATLAPLANGQVYLSTGFEASEGYSTGPLAGQNGWIGTSAAVVETSTVFAGSQAVSLPATGLSGQQSVQLHLSTSSSPIVTLEVHFMQSSSGTASLWAPLVAYGSHGFWSQLVVTQDGHAQMGLASSSVGNVAVSRGVWNDYQMVINSQNGTVTAYVNSQLIGSGPLGSSGNLILVQLQLNDSPGTDTGYFDQLFVTPASGVVTGTYYTNPAPNCPNSQGVTEVDDDSGQKIGSACSVSGTFVWFAAGGPPNNPWKSSIRVAAPDTGAIKAEYLFYDTSGNDLPLDVVFGDGTQINDATGINAILNPNQPLEVDLLGATSNPSHNTTQTGSVYAQFLCPDDVTCSKVGAQLVYSALPKIPWSLSVPLGSFTMYNTTYSAQGIDDGGTHRVSFVLYNNGNTDTAFNVYVYDSDGNLAATGVTPIIPGYNSVTDQGGTYGALLSQVVTEGLPSGLFKVVFDGGTAGEHSLVEVLQFDGASATNLQVYPETSPTLLPSNTAQPRSHKYSKITGASRVVGQRHALSGN